MNTITTNESGTTFAGPAAVSIFRAMALRSALKFYAEAGRPVNRLYTPKRMMQVASSITGKTYGRRAYLQAASDLASWIEVQKLKLDAAH